jgi:hypothetical protein
MGACRDWDPLDCEDTNRRRWDSLLPTQRRRRFGRCSYRMFYQRPLHWKRKRDSRLGFFDRDWVAVDDEVSLLIFLLVLIR